MQEESKPLLSHRDVFDRVRAHLLAQGQRAYDVAKIACRYRMETDAGALTCAVGCLIPPEAYRPSMEDKPIVSSEIHRALIDAAVLPPPALSTHDDRSARLSLLRNLQSLHDNADPVDWEGALGVMDGWLRDDGERWTAPLDSWKDALTTAQRDRSRPAPT